MLALQAGVLVGKLAALRERDGLCSVVWGCGACCIAPSISSAIPGMPNGKPAGQRCVQLNAANQCLLFGLPERPAVCSAFNADEQVCGKTDSEALQLLTWLEQVTTVSAATSK